MSVDLQSHVLSFLTFFPLLGAVVCILLPGKADREIKAITAVITGVNLLVAGWLYMNFDPTVSGVQFIERVDWIPMFNIQYFMGVDGISISLVLLTALVSFIATFASFGIDKQVKGYFVLYLILNTGMFGTFCALDFFLFFIFWEVMLLPMYFLIGIWGGPRREYAAIKFFLFTMGGSVLMLLGMLALYFEGGRTFDILKLIEMGSQGAFKGPMWSWVWWGLFIAFIVKVPSFPFHTWLPDAHVEAPTPISVILAGVLLKMGGYGLIRFNLAIFPDISQHFSWWMALLGVISILYGGLCAMAQQDFKKLVAYASVSSMGFAMLGTASMTAAGINGAIFQMVAHGFYSSMLFIIVGVIYDRAHHRDLEAFGGLATQMPKYAGISGLAFMAALGLPGLCVFISEAMILIGSFRVFPAFTILAATSVILTAAYMLWTVQRVFLGKLNERYKDYEDLTPREAFTLYPLAICVVVFGFYPMPILNLISSSVTQLVGLFGTVVPAGVQ
jgi:NADH-quinone oxidoreductase subunit M